MAVKKKETSRPEHSGFEGTVRGRDVKRENIRFNKDGTYDIVKKKKK